MSGWHDGNFQAVLPYDVCEQSVLQWVRVCVADVGCVPVFDRHVGVCLLQEEGD